MCDEPMTADATALARTLTGIDSRSYGAYKQLKGSYDLGCVPPRGRPRAGRPLRPPSLMRVIVDRADADLPEDLLSDHRGRVATTDFLARAVARAAAELGEGISAGAPGQEVLERTSIALTAEGVEARLAVPLPAAGRRIRGREAAVCSPSTSRASPRRRCSTRASMRGALRDHVTLHRDQEALRDQLAERGLVGLCGRRRDPAPPRRRLGPAARRRRRALREPLLTAGGVLSAQRPVRERDGRAGRRHGDRGRRLPRQVHAAARARQGRLPAPVG